MAFVNGSSTVHAASASWTVNLPASLALNTIVMFAFVSGTTHNSTGTPPTGVTKIEEFDAPGGDESITTFWYRALGTEGATLAFPSIFDASEAGVSLASAYSGRVTTGSPINAQATPEESASGTAKDSPNVTPAVDNCDVVAYFGIDPATDPLTFTPDANVNLRAHGSTAGGAIDAQNALEALIVSLDKSIVGGAGVPVSLGGDLSGSDSAVEVAYALAPAVAASVIPDLVMAPL